MATGGTLGRGTAGTAPVGSWSDDPTGPSISTFTPANGDLAVPDNATITIVWTAPDGIDPFSLQVTVAGQPAVAGGSFYSGSYGGSISVDANTATIIISTHPDFAGGSTTVSTSATDLEANNQSASVTFQAIVTVAVSDTITITDATAFHQVGFLSVSDTVTITDAATPSAGIHESLSDTVTISDATTLHEAGHVSVADTVTVSDAAVTARHVITGVSDSVTITDATSFHQHGVLGVADTDTIAESLLEFGPQHLFVTDTIGITEHVGLVAAFNPDLPILIDFIEHNDQFFTGVVCTNTTLIVTFGQGIRRGVRITEAVTLTNYSVVPFKIEPDIDEILSNVPIEQEPGPMGFPISLLSVTPSVNTIASGSNASILDPQTVQIPGANFTVDSVGNYLFFNSPTNPNGYVRITQVLDAQTVHVDTPLIVDPLNGSVLWLYTTTVVGVVIGITKPTNNELYRLTIGNLIGKLGDPFPFDVVFQANSTNPQVQGASVTDEGNIVVTFSDGMLIDGPLLDPGEYRLTGPGSPYIERVATTEAPNQVLLYPRNTQGGSYSLVVGTHTPHDLAGNPIDPFFNTVAFMSSPPIESRSIFTDFGPIARPPLTLETGTGVSFLDFQTVQLTGAAIPASYAGFELTLSGTALNDGTYLIVAVKTQNTVKVVADFNIPDSGGGTATWAVVNPRDGEIADDPAHVSVTINGSPVVPEEVVGLLGQIVLPSVPPPGQDVRVNYSWVLNPTVEIRRLNSREFRLNDWNRDLGYIKSQVAGHNYRYNNVLPVTTNFTTPPSVQQGTHAGIVSTTQVYLPDGNVLADYAGLTLVLTSGINAGAYDIVSVPDSHHINVSGTLNLADPLSGNIPWTIGDTSDIQAILPQPLLRDLKYRAYERAYTALLNDPNTLTLNAPTNLIAYPPLARIIPQTFVSYESSVLPENDSVAPWTRAGTGTAAIVDLQLVVTSPTAGTFPGGTPIFWVREVDQTFPHVFASTWDMQIDATPVTQGVFTGIAFGYSDDLKAVVFGYLNDGGTAKIGFLVKGAGNDPSVITAWTGGLDNAGNPTNAPMMFDWTILHSYRIYQDQSGTISLYLDGAVIPSLRVTQDQLPYLEELAAPFNSLQGVFFGSLSAQAANTSTWDFVRYTVLPLNPLQSAPSIFVDYVANVIPEESPKPWTPVGYHGTETILGGAFLLLDSTSAVPASTEALTGLIGGDFRGYFRLEPLIAANAEVVVDFNLQLRTWTQGFSPNAMMVAIDDNDRLIQLSFISDTAGPKFSYGGDGFPTDQTPPWQALGTQTAVMHGRTLQIIDASPTDGLVYVIDDTNPVTPEVAHHFAQVSMSAGSSMMAQPGFGFSASVSMIASASTTLNAGVNRPATASMTGHGLVLPTVQLSTDPGQSITEAGFIQADSSIAASATSAKIVDVMMAADSSMAASPVVTRGAFANIEATAICDASVLVSPHTRVLSPDNGYILEARLQPLSFTPDLAGFIGAMAQVYDSLRTVGFSLLMISGTPYVALQGDGTIIAQFPYNWNDGDLHTYRVVYSPGFPSGVVTLFIDGVLVGTPQNYTAFPVPFPPTPTGFVAFGSSSPGTESISVVNWIYCNAWRVENGQKFVGIWRGTNTGTLIDYWLPTKATGSQALILGNALMDTGVNFVTAGVQITDYLIVDAGPNAGVYQITGVTANTLSVDITWPSAPSRVAYRIAQQTDWTQQHSYRIAKAPSGDDVAVFLDSSTTPLIFLTYDDTILPPSTAGLPRIISGALPSIVWGAFDPTNLSQSSWQYVRYGVTRSPTELRIIPPHQVLNQRNVMQSYERHLSNLPHTLTDFWSESEGITPNTDPDFLTNPGLVAFTLLNEGTPLVPETQTYEVRSPQPVTLFTGSLNNIADVLNSNGSFLLNDATRRVGIIVPNDVLYNSLQIIERDTGQLNLIAPFSDESQPTYGPIYYQNEVCLTYDALTLPENDPTAITPWTFFAQDSSHVSRSVFGGVLTYGTDGVGTQTLYRNSTPLPDAPSLGTEVKFRLKVLQDSSGGLGDSQVRFGFSAIGLTASLALISAPTGQRYVLVVDQVTNLVLGGIPFDFYDGNFHTYRLVRNPGAGNVQIFVDS